MDVAWKYKPHHCTENREADGNLLTGCYAADIDSASWSNTQHKALPVLVSLVSSSDSYSKCTEMPWVKARPRQLRCNPRIAFYHKSNAFAKRELQYWDQIHSLLIPLILHNSTAYHTNSVANTSVNPNSPMPIPHCQFWCHCHWHCIAPIPFVALPKMICMPMFHWPTCMAAIVRGSAGAALPMPNASWDSPITPTKKTGFNNWIFTLILCCIESDLCFPPKRQDLTTRFLPGVCGKYANLH